jgi:hypothetical protein
MYDFQVSFDANQAERDIRMVKLKQTHRPALPAAGHGQISGTFRTVTGTEGSAKFVATSRPLARMVTRLSPHYRPHWPVILSSRLIIQLSLAVLAE